MTARFALIAVIFFCAAARVAVAQSTPQAVAQTFYAAWVKASGTPHGAEATLAASQALLDPALYKLVVDVYALGEKHRDTIEGYDGDPFLDTQDEVTKFRLGAPTTRKGVASVALFVTGGRGGKPEGPERMVGTVQLQQIGGRWRITDLIYGHGQDAGGVKSRSLRKWSQELLADYRKRHK
jgi:hypothetical protein